MKYSIVIPTYNNCEAYLKPCIDSILKYTNVSEIELIISANGCTDNTQIYLEYLQSAFDSLGLHSHLKIVWNDKALGYPKATNEGIKVAITNYIVLLNNDTVLLDQHKNQWLEMLEKPLQNQDNGISGVVTTFSDCANTNFAIFFCVMIRHKVFLHIGYLDESYGVGSGEDIELCIKAKEAGFNVVCAQENGYFPIYHRGEGTVHNTDLVKDWDTIYLKNQLKLAKKYNPEWYRSKLTNGYERAVFLNGDNVLPRETTRYKWAGANLTGTTVCEIGCSTGYGSQFFVDKTYTGIDYDPIIIEVAREQQWNDRTLFKCGDINTIPLINFDSIVAFEVVEHLDNGMEIVDKLKKYCKRLLISVPHNEPKGFWGEHHKLHGLTEQDFPNFKFAYINEHGTITDTLEPISPSNKCNLMLCRWDNE
jgi:GT2 family glycosyltransferase